MAPSLAAQDRGLVEKQAPLNVVLQQTGEALQQALDLARGLNQRFMPTPEKANPSAPAPSGVISQANELRNQAQRLIDELTQLGERI